MPMSKTLASYLHFFWAGVVKQGQTGAIVPSQRFLIAKMIAPVPEDYDGQIIELGAGNGAIPSLVAARCPRACVLACEINPPLARDNRAHLAQAGLGEMGAIVAGKWGIDFTGQHARARAPGGHERGDRAVTGAQFDDLPVVVFGHGRDHLGDEEPLRRHDRPRLPLLNDAGPEEVEIAG